MSTDFKLGQENSQTMGRSVAPTLGIHHITTFASEPQANADFYTKVLGLRLVKITVNFDDPTTYHLYFGDEAGSPGTILTFFPIVHAARGRRGTGEVSATAFAAPRGSLGYWRARLEGLNVRTTELSRFGGVVLGFTDGDGTSLELVETDSAAVGSAGAGVPRERAIHGFYGVTLSVHGDAQTEKLLTEHFGFQRTLEDGLRTRFVSATDEGQPGRVLDLVRGGGETARRELVVGAGSVHHIAMRVRDDAAQLALARGLGEAGYRVTEQRDRCYFRSVYFRETGGVLFEIATDGPGFATDEAQGELGSLLKLPHWLERKRADIAASLPVFSSGAYVGAMR